MSSRGDNGSEAMKTNAILEQLLRVRRGQETFDGLPAQVWQVHTLQQKTSWSREDHAKIAALTRRWTDKQRRRYEQRWNWGRPARWR